MEREEDGFVDLCLAVGVSRTTAEGCELEDLIGANRWCSSTSNEDRGRGRGRGRGRNLFGGRGRGGRGGTLLTRPAKKVAPAPAQFHLHLLPLSIHLPLENEKEGEKHGDGDGVMYVNGGFLESDEHYRWLSDNLSEKQNELDYYLIRPQVVGIPLRTLTLSSFIETRKRLFRDAQTFQLKITEYLQSVAVAARTQYAKGKIQHRYPFPTTVRDERFIRIFDVVTRLSRQMEERVANPIPLERWLHDWTLRDRRPTPEQLMHRMACEGKITAANKASLLLAVAEDTMTQSLSQFVGGSKHKRTRDTDRNTSRGARGRGRRRGGRVVRNLPFHVPVLFRFTHHKSAPPPILTKNPTSAFARLPVIVPPSPDQNKHPILMPPVWSGIVKNNSALVKSQLPLPQTIRVDTSQIYGRLHITTVDGGCARNGDLELLEPRTRMKAQLRVDDFFDAILRRLQTLSEVITWRNVADNLSPTLPVDFFETKKTKLAGLFGVGELLVAELFPQSFRENGGAQAEITIILLDYAPKLFTCVAQMLFQYSFHVALSNPQLNSVMASYLARMTMMPPPLIALTDKNRFHELWLELDERRQHNQKAYRAITNHHLPHERRGGASSGHRVHRGRARGRGRGACNSPPLLSNEALDMARDVRQQMLESRTLMWQHFPHMIDGNTVIGKQLLELPKVYEFFNRKKQIIRKLTVAVSELGQSQKQVRYWESRLKCSPQKTLWHTVQPNKSSRNTIVRDHQTASACVNQTSKTDEQRYVSAKTGFCVRAGLKGANRRARQHKYLQVSRGLSLAEEFQLAQDARDEKRRAVEQLQAQLNRFFSDNNAHMGPESDIIHRVCSWCAKTISSAPRKPQKLPKSVAKGNRKPTKPSKQQPKQLSEQPKQPSKASDLLHVKRPAQPAKASDLADLKQPSDPMQPSKASDLADLKQPSDVVRVKRPKSLSKSLCCSDGKGLAVLGGGGVELCGSCAARYKLELANPTSLVGSLPLVASLPVGTVESWPIWSKSEAVRQLSRPWMKPELMVHAHRAVDFKKIHVWRRRDFFTSDGRGKERLVKQYHEVIREAQQTLFLDLVDGAESKTKRVVDMSGEGEYVVAARDREPCGYCQGCNSSETERVCEGNWYPAFLSIHSCHLLSSDTVVNLSFRPSPERREPATTTSTNAIGVVGKTEKMVVARETEKVVVVFFPGWAPVSANRQNEMFLLHRLKAGDPVLLRDHNIRVIRWNDIESQLAANIGLISKK